MKLLKLHPLLLLIVLSSCSSVKVTSDYDTKAEFKTYKTFAFTKKELTKQKSLTLIKREL